MLSKIYYGLGIGIILIYLLANLLSLRSGGSPQTRSFGVMRMERGKYVYVAPSYPSDNPYSTSGGKSGSRSSSYPSSGGYSGGK